MSDGSGTGSGVTTYAYHPVGGGLGGGQASSINGSLSSDVISFTYDELGRVATRTLNGNAVGFSYDNLGRRIEVDNSLGTFDTAYVDETSRLDTVTYPNGVVADYSYYPDATSTPGTGNGDFRLAQMRYDAGSTPISQFDYAYSPTGMITDWSTTAGASAAVENGMRYDAADRLLDVTRTQSAAPLNQFAYRYDAANNRTSERVDSTLTTATHNSTNEIVSLTGGGSLGISGTTDEEADVTVDAQPAATSQAGRSFQRDVAVSSGVNTVNVTATDPSGNATSQNYEITVSPGVGQSFSHDANGNLLSDGTRSYAWDAENRLVTITQGAETTTLEYDGLNRWTRILEKSGSTTVSDQRFIWSDTQLNQQRNGTATSAVQRFFAEGVQRGTNLYFYTRDHLGSVREVTDNSGTVVARYDYDPYGRRTKMSGSFDSDFGYTGHYQHAPSGLAFAPYRMYNAETGRWLNRDPIAEEGGLNLYAYVANNPVNSIDPWGLFDFYHRYRNGGGDITLSEAGLADAFENAWSVKAAVQSFGWELTGESRRQARSACGGKDTGTEVISFNYRSRTTTNVTNERGLFAVGNSTFFRDARATVVANCCTKTFTSVATNHFYIRDWFRDPYDTRRFGIVIENGAPYQINHDFNKQWSYRGSF